MLKYFSSKLLLLTILFLGINKVAEAQTDPIEKVWYNQEKTAKIQVYKAKDGRFYGKMVWLKEPLENGKPKVDKENPDEKKRNTPLLGLILLRGLEKDGDKEYDGGKIYDPKNGKTYSCKITHNGNTLDLRGFVGISLIGRTSTWTLAE
ncbi:SIGNAL peptide protein [Chitinophagaceae bacterium IBVUCB1]|nr:SIGNAL peptide protein [Chitinophagaceae bacterium IBVUCB1]